MISILRVLCWALGSLIVLLCVVWFLVYMTLCAEARDLEGRFVNSPLHDWFQGLRSGKGPCCSDADGNVVKDPDWESVDGHYRVRINGEWVDVPEDAVITEPNRFGQTMVWPWYQDGKPKIRCFMPGAMI